MTSAPVTETETPDFKNYSLTMDPPACRDALCIFYAVMNSFSFILGVAGNGLVIWIAGFKIKKSVNSIWYLSLAVSDFIFCSSLTLDIVYMIKDDWIFGLFLCKFWYFNSDLNMFSSIFLLVIISVDRCVVVMFPVWPRNQRTVRKASVIVMITWIISAVLSMPTALTLDVWYNETQKSFCVHDLSNDQQHVAYVVCGFLIPYLLIVISYVLIMQKIKSNSMARSKKPLKIMTVLIVTFLICWLPYHTFVLIALNPNYISILPPAITVVAVLANTNSCMNPFLNAFMGKDIKDQCYAILSKIENAIEEQEDQFSKQGTATATSEKTMASSTV